ncbi:MAG: DUF6493 family protein [Pseudomonadota bacterium]
MTEDELIAFMRTASGPAVLDRLSAIPAADRRAYAPAMLALYKSVDRAWLAREPAGPRVADSDAVIVGVLATATLSELKKLSFGPFPGDLPLEQVIGALKPDWAEAWVAWLIETRPILTGRLAPLWESGLIPRPTGDAFILGHYALGHFGWQPEAHPAFFETDVWRFFEVEGGGEFSLAAHDKYANAETGTWAYQLLAEARTGRLDRARLLDASLDTLERDFAPFRAGWYSRFHTALEPTAEEQRARAGRYLVLLSSTVSPTVSFALKAVTHLEKAGALAPGELLAALDTPLQARQKSTCLGALKLVAAAAKRDPGLRAQAAHGAARALVSEAAEVQAKALDLIEALADGADTGLRSTLAEYLPVVAPSVRGRLSALAEEDAAPPQVEAEGVEGARPAQPISLVETAADALSLFLSVLEQCRDPFDIERAMDGLSRHGAALRADETALSPLRKRAQQVWKNPGDSETRAVLALTGRALAEGVTFDALVGSSLHDEAGHSLGQSRFSHVQFQRNAEVIAQILDGARLPMLSAPSETSGCVAPSDLVARLVAYRAAGRAPGSTDLSLALLRLAQGGRAEALASMDPLSESDRAVAYALGGRQTPGASACLWAAAWAARQPAEADATVAALFDPPQPDCGIPAAMELKVTRSESNGYHWIFVDVAVAPPEPDAPAAALPAMFYPKSRYTQYHDTACGWQYPDVAWASLVLPAWQAPFFRQALLSMDTMQKLSDHYCAAFLEPFFRPGPAVGTLGAATLAYYMASEDKGVAALAADAVVSLAAEERITPCDLAGGLLPFLASNALPTGRWTKGFTTIAGASSGAADFVRATITDVLGRLGEAEARDMGGMLELLYELHVASQTAPQHPAALGFLRAAGQGGKVGKFSKRLLQLAA